MSHNTALFHRMTRFRVPLLTALMIALGACDGGNSLDPDSSGNAAPVLGDGGIALEDPMSLPDGAVTDSLGALPSEGLPLASSTFSGGIPFGSFNQPVSWFGSLYNGAKRTVGPYTIKSTLSGIKSRGGKVVLMLAGHEKYYKDANGHFSLTKWKQRINRFRGINFSSYINDGTIIGHYMIDEPQDPTNWNGRPISPSTVDEMGRYSKQLWPGMVTIVRTEPKFFNSNPRYVDAAWAQYLTRLGNPSDYIRRNVREAQNRGLALVVGLNVIKGGRPNGTAMTASEVKSFGAALLSSSYPCAFISWQYRSSYLNTSSIRDAMRYLSNKAENRSTRRCRT